MIRDRSALLFYTNFANDKRNSGHIGKRAYLSVHDGNIRLFCNWRAGLARPQQAICDFPGNKPLHGNDVHPMVGSALKTAFASDLVSGCRDLGPPRPGKPGPLSKRLHRSGAFRVRVPGIVEPEARSPLGGIRRGKQINRYLLVRNIGELGGMFHPSRMTVNKIIPNPRKFLFLPT
jgi:hypothetical protein